MGHRTIVIFNNDITDQWGEDPELGKKIQRASPHAMGGKMADFGTGRVVECCHADQQTLAVIDSTSMFPIVHSSWHRDQTWQTRDLGLLRLAAEKMGYRLVKKATK